MVHRWSVAAFLVCLCLLLPACNNYEKENKHLKDELRMLKEENDFLKAQVVGLKMEITELRSKVEQERTELQVKFEKERVQLQEKFQEEREAMQKKVQQIVKTKNGTNKTEPKTSAAAKKETKEGTSKTAQLPTNDKKNPVPRTSAGQ